MPHKILVVDDQPKNVKLLADILSVKGYEVTTAESGADALVQLRRNQPDLVLLDVMMPGMNGYEVCQAIRADPALSALPVVLVTALDPSERIKGLEAGADDFLSKPINQPELLVRVRSLLRVKVYHDTIQAQAQELRDWNERLEHRVQDQIKQLESLGRLKGFFSADLAEAIVSGGAEELLKPHRREIVVVFLDLRGFTEFTESVEPEEVMSALSQYHEIVGNITVSHGGTIERFAGDGMMIFFNDPIVLSNAPESAVRMALELRERFVMLRSKWSKHGYDLHLGIGIAQGYATLGTIGFEGRRDYAAIGSVTNLSARLCSEAQGGQVLINQKLLGQIEELVLTEPIGTLSLKGFRHPVLAFNITGLR